MRTRLQLGHAPADHTPLDDDVAERIDLASDILAGRRTAVLTGAGISTDSGIPDYRSPGSPPRTPMTLEMFLSSPEFRRHYWARNHVGWRHMDAALPNPAHLALTGLQDQGRVSAVITQNVDMLHTKAGTRGVLELHGCYGRVRCLRCDWRISRHRLAQQLEEINTGFAERVAGRGAIEVAPDADAMLADTTDFRMIDCPHCGGILKPDIVYFGETVPKPLVEQSFSAVDEADALLVVGSSLTVMSGLRFARRAHRAGKPLIIVNRGHTRADELASLKIDHRAGVVLPALANR
ncbi:MULTISPECIES: Sir2 family NAD-dependent protein deacetylase [Gordonia]|uniref:NAD-dependent protein deacetylase n=2 Tax=Gordonia alkanivorans TaxID=84096 RepID=F9VT51_9ACTN|nr:MULTISPECIES: Sir2 family NAD-dependent protein deacetylase [Gordonia]AZZ81890.1 NAD-dependent deacetylase [Gordonia alkanivorans]ETA08052.1 NAD-dependent deacetylase [Gordonia alkanivorans CGMCC 6845]MDH3006306.1 Sir2 family NAD-dependent protein deacetylase [Gordonia alkanivorans]MDH3009621.1 Sir2 family NAD-dependent protein deacetylase [Gordonia alkanivorans]MDH3014064.1 Sir2 family NAD-dependent protein deacetylase [Gordonia alkanivorans]